MQSYVVHEGCPIGCGVDVIIMKCLPSGRLIGWCWECEGSMPIPLPTNYAFTEEDMDSRRYAPEGLIPPEWSEVEAAGLSDQIIRVDKFKNRS